jgi:ribosomal protein S7
LVGTAKKNKQLPVAESLANEIISTVFFKRSETLKKKSELYDTVVKNRAYGHYR